MKKVLTATFAFLMIASLATAQMHGPAMPAPTNGMGGMGDMGHGPDGGGAGLQVASNGTVILTSVTFDSATRTSTTTIKAVSPTGSVLWTQTLTNAHGGFVLSGNNLLSVSDTVASDGTVTTTITAINVTSGATAWTKTMNGRVTDLRPFTGGTYAVVVVPATTSGGPATRSLIAISDTGATIFTISL